MNLALGMAIRSLSNARLIDPCDDRVNLVPTGRCRRERKQGPVLLVQAPRQAPHTARRLADCPSGGCSCIGARTCLGEPFTLVPSPRATKSAVQSPDLDESGSTMEAPSSRPCQARAVHPVAVVGEHDRPHDAAAFYART